MKLSFDKETIDRVIANTASAKEAMEVAEWLSSTEEGQQHLLDMLDTDINLMNNDPHCIEGTMSQSQSDSLYEKIERLI